MSDKRFAILLLTLAIGRLVAVPDAAKAQFCVIEDASIVQQKTATKNYLPDGSIKFLRVFLHFIQQDDGSGNFNKENDGLNPPNNNFNGYDFANYIVEYANGLLQDNQPMRIQPFGNIPVYDPGYRYKLSGVFFWKNSLLYSQYYALNTLQNNYGQSTNSAINIFITSPQGSTGGYVRYYDDNAVLLFTPYLNYQNSVLYNNFWFNRASATILNHEVGHCLNLLHTILTGGGTCCTACDDFCSDTPSIVDLINIGEPSHCCWNGDTCSNNMMDYNADQQSITPEQLNRVHLTLENSKHYFLSGNYAQSNLYINSFINGSGAYIAEKVYISGPAIINDGEKVYIECKEVTFDSGFEIQLGGSLDVEIN
jgi:hypothetical protein